MEQLLPAVVLKTIWKNTGLTSEQKVARYYSEIVKSFAGIETFVSNHENYPTIHTLKNEYGFNFVFELLVAMIADLVSSLNVPKLSEHQIYEIAKELIEDCQTLKPEDFQRFFLNMKKGKYGEIYNRIDIQVIYSALSKYNEERIEYFETNLHKRKVELNGDEKAIRTDGTTENINDVMKKVYSKEIEKAAREKEIEKIFESNKLQWKLEAVENWNKNKEIYYDQNPEASDMYYDYNFPKSDYINWFLTKKKHEITL